jgi:hypothetical protein
MSGVGDEPVWYVAYGSNKVPARFHTYLRGGRPPGSRRHYLGARNPELPARSVDIRIPHRLFFAGDSPVWGGGVAFVDPRPDPAHSTPAVAWLITTEQLSDLIAQENGDEAPGPMLSVLPRPGGHQVVAVGRYDMLVGLAAIEGIAAATLTASDPPAPNEPSTSYLALVEHRGGS